MLKLIDKLLDRITMYRLVLYFLLGLLLAALVLAFFGRLPFAPWALLYSFSLLLLFCWLANRFLRQWLKVATNYESFFITALILALIISPPKSGEYLSVIPFLLLASAVAMASKFLINLGKKHIFNPAAFAVYITSIIIGKSASWWVGTLAMLPFVLIGGILMLRKLRQFHLALGFLIAATITTIAVAIPGAHVFSSLYGAYVFSPLVFFATVMLTEPMTMPPNRDGRIAYGILVGMLFNPLVHFGSIFFSPEEALLVGNLFAYLVSPKTRHAFKLLHIQKAGKGIYDFVLQPDRRFKFKPGQYMEWTLSHEKPDSRGNRRYFTLASSPTEKLTVLGVRFYENSSSFKKNMIGLRPGSVFYGGQLSGDFVLPDDRAEKLVFVAGGIGITPFRSMIQYLLDKQEKRDIYLLYSNRNANEVAYAQVFAQAKERLGIPVIYTLTGKSGVPPDWTGQVGHINAGMIKNEIPDYYKRTFYVSGSKRLVDGVKELLLNMGLHRRQIKSDFFPGLV